MVERCVFEHAILCLVCLMLSFDCPLELVEGALMTTHESNHSEQTVWTRMVRLPEKPFPVLVGAMDESISLPFQTYLCMCVWFHVVCFLWMLEKYCDFCTWDENTNIEATTV